MPTIETSIWLALKGRVATLAITPTLSVDWPKSDFTPPVSGSPALPQPYLEVRFLPNQALRRFAKGSNPHERTGILQLTLCYPTALGHVEEVDRELAGKIAEHFPADLPLVHSGVQVRIERAPDIARGIKNDAYWRTPVSVRWYCFA